MKKIKSFLNQQWRYLILGGIVALYALMLMHALTNNSGATY